MGTAGSHSFGLYLAIFRSRLPSESYSLRRIQVREALPQCIVIHCLFLVVIYGLVTYTLELIAHIGGTVITSPGGIASPDITIPFKLHALLGVVILAILFLQMRWIRGILDRANEA